MSQLFEQWKQEDSAESSAGVIRTSLEAAPDMDSRKVAKTASLATHLELPEHLVIENPYKASQENAVRKMAQNPHLATWIQEDKFNAALLRDDAEPMLGVFERAGQLWDRESGGLARSWDKGMGQLRLAWLGNRYHAGDDSALEEAEQVEKASNPFAEQEAFGILQPSNLPDIEQVLSPKLVYVHAVGDKAVLLPRHDENGLILSKDQAVALWMETGLHGGMFASEKQAAAFLVQNHDKKRQLYFDWKPKEESWVETTFGPGAGVEQLPRMLFFQFPKVIEKAAWGALGGFAVGAGTALALGQAGPQVALPEEIVTVPPAALAGAALGGKAGWLLGTAESAFYSERGIFTLELARARDANGEKLPREVVESAATIYGFLAAVEEGAFEALFLSLLKPLGLGGIVEKFGQEGTRGLLRSAIKRAAFDQSVRAKILDAGARIGANALGEGTQEALQEATGILVESLAKDYSNRFDGKNFIDKDLFTGENAHQIGEAFKGGTSAGFWLGSGPIIVSGMVDINSARQSKMFAEQHLQLYETVETTATKSLSPKHMQSALEAANPVMFEQLYLPADAVLELYQNGTDILSPLGLSEQDASEASRKGQDLIVTASRLHAYLDRAQFEAAVNIMRRNPDAMSLADTATVDTRLAENTERITAVFQEQQQELAELTKERERLRTEAVAAIEAVPGLKAQTEALAEGVEAYVSDWVNTVEKYTLRMAVTGQRPVEVFRRVAFNSLKRGQASSGIALYQKDDAVVGEVNLSMASGLPFQKQGEIILLPEDLQHIEDIHGEQIRGLGYGDARAFIMHILSHVDAIYQGNSKRTFALMTRQTTPNGQVVAKLEFRHEGDGYRIITANPVRKGFFDKKTPLWERAQSNLFQEEIPGASGGNHATADTGQSEAFPNFTTFQTPVNRDVKGSIQVHPEGYLIALFQKADLSTLLHETGHIFLEETSLAIRSGIADGTMIRDYEALQRWFSRFDDVAVLREEYNRSVKNVPVFQGRKFEELSDAEKAESRRIAEKEYFARGFEAYLMEGKAPSRDLEGPFSRFKKWLLAVYRDIKSLNVELNDDVRGVFERMISMEKEVAYAAARNELLDLTQKELDALGITGPAREYAGKLMAAARDAAAQNLAQDRNRDRKRRLGQYAREAREELMKLPLYIARSDIRKSPLDAALVRELYGEETAKALRKSLPFGLKEEGGVDPEIFAAEHGFASGTEMVAQILEAPSMKKAAQQRVQEKEAAHAAMFPPADYLVETVQANEQVAMVGKYLAQNLGRQHVQQEAFARVAEQELSAMPLSKAMQTGNFLAAMRRALRQERLAIGRGDFAAALEANHKARLNMEFARRSRDITKTQGVVQRLVKRFIGMSKADPDARYIVMDVGMRHGLNTYNERLGEGRDVRTIQTWFTDADADGYTVYADDAILYGPGKPWREMTLTEFETLSEVINQIVTVERNKRKLLTAQGQADLDTVVDSIAGSIYEHRNPKAVKTVEGQPAALKVLKGIHTIHMKVESICIALDGDTRGPTWEAIYLPITKADDARSIRFKEMRDALVGSNLFGTYTRQELARMGSQKELVQEIGESLTWENRIAVALNMGNEANINRIKNGHNWNDEQIAAVLRPLTKRDWAFVQSVWDYIGSFKEEAFALQEEVSGMRPVSVEAQPFIVQTSDGEHMPLRGGYYPIKYNAEKGFLAFMQEQKATDKELFGGRNYGAAMTKNGHLKERANGGMGSPLLLELSVITDHLFNVMHDITYRKAVLDVAKVIKHKTVREAIDSTVGRQIYRELMPWLQDVANERQEPMHAVHRWAHWARSSSSVMTMGYKFTTMFAQPLGFTQSIELLGYKWAGAGLKRVYRNPLKLPELLEETFARSSFMANRIKSFDREIRDITKQLKPSMSRFAWVDKVKENAFVPMGIFQMGVDLPTWWGAFEKGIKDFSGNEQQAAQYADSVVRMSQGSGSTKDLARVQRGGEMLRMTTMFYSYFNTLYNLGARGITALKKDRSPSGIFKAANTALLLWFVPAVLSELFAGRGPGHDDDDEGVGEWAAMNLLQYPFQAIVGVRDIGNAVFGEYGYQITPAQSAPKSIVNWFKAVNKALEEEDVGKLVEPTAEAVGYLFGLPMKQPIITVGNLWDYITSEDPELYARDLFFMKPKDRR